MENIKYKHHNFTKHLTENNISERIKEIAEIKMPDLNAANIESAMSMVKGTARSMGITVEG